MSGRLKPCLRPMRGLKRLRSARVISTGQAFVQNLRRDHYELATHIDPRYQLSAVFTELARQLATAPISVRSACIQPTQHCPHGPLSPRLA